MGIISSDIVIIGAGAIGLSTAFSCVKHDSSSRVLVLGNKDASGGASRAAGAMLGCYGEVTSNSFKSKHGRKKFYCSLQAKKMWDGWVGEINEHNESDKIKINHGTYILHNNASGLIDTENFQAIEKALIDDGELFDKVAFSEIPGVNTLENFRSLDALYLPKEGSICSESLLSGLYKALKTYKNFSALTEAVEKINISGGKITSVQLTNKDIVVGQQYVLAAGAFSQVLLDQVPDLAKTMPRILPGIGQALVISRDKSKCAIQNVIRTPNRAGACGLHILPYGENLYVGATNELKISPEDKPSVGMIHFVLQCTMDQLNQNLFPEKIIDIKVGNRPSSLDGFPLLGECSIDNLIILTGTYRDGFHQAPYIAQEAGKNIFSGIPILDNIFKPERDPIEVMSRNEAINEAVDHQMATAYEAGAILPHAFWSESMRRNIRADIRNFYEQLKVDMNLLPEHTLMFRDHQTDKDFMNFFKDYFERMGHNNIEKSKTLDMLHRRTG